MRTKWKYIYYTPHDYCTTGWSRPGRSRLLVQAAGDHVQPAFDPGPLLRIADRKHPPALEAGARLQATPAGARPRRKTQRDLPVQPAHLFAHREQRIARVEVL